MSHQVADGGAYSSSSSRVLADRFFVNQLTLPSSLVKTFPRAAWKMALAFFALLLAVMAAHAQQQQGANAANVTDAPPASSRDEKAPLVIDNVEDGDVFGLGQSVIVRGTVKHGVMAFGGDVVVEGTVIGDVAAIGGSVIQRDGSRIGGDVIVLGGAYHHGKTAPERDASSTTVMYAGYEQELRDLSRNPAVFLTPHWSAVYLGQRVLAVLFWFIASMALTAVTPGAVSRASARLQLNSLRVAAIGLMSSIIIVFGVPACLSMLPTAVGALLGVTALLLLVMAYLFGRVVIHAATGRWLQRQFFKPEKHSESIALLLGAAFWAVVLSLPYVWPLVVAGLLVASLGLSLTARHRLNWKRASA
ncbi:MAG: hypothetical protein QOD00_1222 [Blastocatellia bacterium]|jgi:hypothetical protein|nr:hypothetical protein [Blastocatellia bacterium]